MGWKLKFSQQFQDIIDQQPPISPMRASELDAHPFKTFFFPNLMYNGVSKLVQNNFN